MSLQHSHLRNYVRNYLVLLSSNVHMVCVFSCSEACDSQMRSA